MFRSKTFVFPAAALLLLTACAPTVKTTGNLLSPSKLAQVQPLVSTRTDVTTHWGPPTAIAPFDTNIWYYIGETTSQKGVFEPEVEKRQSIQVTFGEGDIVTEVAVLDPAKAREIEIVERRTPTAGKEFTAFQQFVGNLGKFNSEDLKKK